MGATCTTSLYCCGTNTNTEINMRPSVHGEICSDEANMIQEHEQFWLQMAAGSIKKIVRIQAVMRGKLIRLRVGKLKALLQ